MRFTVEEVADDLVARLVLIDLVPCRTEEARLGLAHHRIQLGAEVEGLVLLMSSRGLLPTILTACAAWKVSLAA